MTKKNTSISTILISLIVMLLTATALIRDYSKSRNSNADVVQYSEMKPIPATISLAQEPNLNCRFYTMPDEPNISANDYFGFYENSDSVGVPADIASEYESRYPEFLTIGEQSAARLQFLQSQNLGPLEDGLHWSTLVDRIAIVNGQTRLRVITSLGKDVPDRGGKAAESLYTLEEIWQLSDSSAPTLLDRMRVAYNRDDGGHVFGFKGLKTQAEESPYVIFNRNWPDVLDR